MRSHIGWGRERSILCKSVETFFPRRRVLKTLRGSAEKPKKDNICNGGLGPLQMVSEPDIGRCVSEKVLPRSGVDKRRCASKNAGPKGGGL